MKELIVSDSERLSYRLMDSDDAKDLYELDQDPEVMRFINGGQCSSWETIESVLLPRMQQYRDPVRGWGIWRVSLKASKEYIGWILVRPMHFFTELRNDSDLELGWRFKRSAWGKGYATEAAKTISHALVQSSASINAFSAIADPDNSGSINIMKKLGMSFVKQDIFCDPLVETEVVFYSKKLI